MDLKYKSWESWAREPIKDDQGATNGELAQSGCSCSLCYAYRNYVQAKEEQLSQTPKELFDSACNAVSALSGYPQSEVRLLKWREKIPEAYDGYYIYHKSGSQEGNPAEAWHRRTKLDGNRQGQSAEQIFNETECVPVIFVNKKTKGKEKTEMNEMLKLLLAGAGSAVTEDICIETLEIVLGADTLSTKLKQNKAFREGVAYAVCAGVKMLGEHTELPGTDTAAAIAEEVQKALVVRFGADAYGEVRERLAPAYMHFMSRMQEMKKLKEAENILGPIIDVKEKVPAK